MQRIYCGFRRQKPTDARAVFLANSSFAFVRSATSRIKAYPYGSIVNVGCRVTDQHGHNVAMQVVGRVTLHAHVDTQIKQAVIGKDRLPVTHQIRFYVMRGRVILVRVIAVRNRRLGKFTAATGCGSGRFSGIQIPFVARTRSTQIGY